MRGDRLACWRVIRANRFGFFGKLDQVDCDRTVFLEHPGHPHGAMHKEASRPVRVEMSLSGLDIAGSRPRITDPVAIGIWGHGTTVVREIVKRGGAAIVRAILVAGDDYADHLSIQRVLPCLGIEVAVGTVQPLAHELTQRRAYTHRN